MHMICTVKINGFAVIDTARLYCSDPHTVANWIRHHDEKKITGLDEYSVQADR